MTMSLTVSQLVALVNKLTHEDKQRFIQIVRKLNDASGLSSTPMSVENRSRLKKMKEEND
jgi:hypothetical protein